MLELLLKKKREALVRTNSKENLRKQITKKKNNYVEKAHAFVARNLDILLETTL